MRNNVKDLHSKKQIHQDRAEAAAAAERKIIYAQIEDGTDGRIGQSHNAAQERLARGVHAQTCCQAGASFTAGSQSNGGELLAVANCHLCPGPNQVRKALRKDFALTEGIATEEFAHAERKLDTTTSTWSISHRSAVPAMNAARWVRAQGTAAGGMRCDGRDAHLFFAYLDLLNLHLIAEEGATDCFPSRPRFSLNTVWRVLLESSVSSLLPLPSISAIPDSPKSAMSQSTGYFYTT
jgi:hypothetical protein